ncbi:DUF3558 family protein [Allokutzneria oryzae]|uniref:DUF3558 family protein n=1 Tax=Allokutzneria oryzae TaxID=1378989 RepID=A0ABV6A6U0_9PSEU
MNSIQQKLAWLPVVALSALMTTTGCSQTISGEAVGNSASKTQLNPGKTPTAAELCRLMTPGDFPVQGQLAPGSPKLEEKFSPSCMYQVKIGNIGEVFTASLTLIPGTKLGAEYFENRIETSVAGKRAAIGQGEIRGESGECGVVFESNAGLWEIGVIDNSAPNRDGCAAVRHVGERVIPRVP